MHLYWKQRHAAAENNTTRAVRMNGDVVAGQLNKELWLFHPTRSLSTLTSRYLSNARWVNSYCRWTRKFMFSTEWTTMFINCMQATCRQTQRQFKNKDIHDMELHLFVNSGLWCVCKNVCEPTMKSMLLSSLMKYSISFSKRFFSLLTWDKIEAYLIMHFTLEGQKFKMSLSESLGLLHEIADFIQHCIHELYSLPL